MWTEALQPKYQLQEDQIWTSRTPITSSIDSKPVYDHVNGQMMTLKDKRIAIEMLLVKRDSDKDNVMIPYDTHGSHVS